MPDPALGVGRGMDPADPRLVVRKKGRGRRICLVVGCFGSAVGKGAGSTGDGGAPTVGRASDPHTLGDEDEGEEVPDPPVMEVLVIEQSKL